MWQSFRSSRFPPPTRADEDGLLVVGGELEPDWLLDAYTHGVFPWPIVHGDWSVLAWFSPDPRAIIEFDDVHISRRLRQRLRSGRFEATLDRDFAGVVAACAEPRDEEGSTWITPAMQRAYVRLHKLGVAHSVEVWREGRLAGGVYGVAIGGYFSGESMFHRETDASKVALVHLLNHLHQRGFRLFDVQQWTPHTGRMGASVTPRRKFLRRLRDAIQQRVTIGERLESGDWWA